jgi:hypothetical protein
LNRNQANLDRCTSKGCKEPDSEHVLAAGSRVKNSCNKQES